MSDKSELDQYYTNIDKIRHLIEPLPVNYFYIEPSAGTGEFLKLFNTDHQFIAYDIEPKHNIIIQRDFLNLDFTIELALLKYINKKVVTIGNPPFGKNCNLAIKFFNKCSEIANEIRFILPKTFRKQSIHNKLNLNFHLVSDIDLPKKSFILNNEEYDVPCCYQVWEYRTEYRTILKDYTNTYIEFVTDSTNADLCVRRAGGKAGQVLTGVEHSKSSTYFIKVLDNRVFDVIETLNFSSIKDNTAGVRSVSKYELVEELRKKLNE